MITHGDLQKIAKTRLKDAKVLLDNGCYDGSAYLCGYAVELALKAIVCKNLRLKGIPSTSAEFEQIIHSIQNLKTHNLEKLLLLSGDNIMKEIKSQHLNDWSVVLDWDPEMRYVPPRGQLIKEEAEKLVASTRQILKYFWKQI